MDAGGRGVPRDDRAGINWYLKAAAQSYLPAEVNLGMAYLRVAQAHYIAEAMK
jgi:TPR repeat protein